MKCEETTYWLELLAESGTVKPKLSLLITEADELMAIFSSIVKSSRDG